MFNHNNEEKIKNVNTERHRYKKYVTKEKTNKREKRNIIEQKILIFLILYKNAREFLNFKVFWPYIELLLMMRYFKSIKMFFF